jgi:hypothetical protein
MPFVRRDAEGKIDAVFLAPDPSATEEVSGDHPDLLEFRQADTKSLLEKDEWVQADLALARVTEDLVDLLIDKGVINFTDLPSGAQNKLIKRQGLRTELSYVAKLFGSNDEDDDFL